MRSEGCMSGKGWKGHQRRGGEEGGNKRVT